MEERGKKNIQKTTSCFYKVMSQLFAIHQLTNAGKSRLIGMLREWGEGLQCKGFFMIRRLFQLSLKIFPEFLVKLSCFSKSAALLILLLGQIWGR